MLTVAFGESPASRTQVQLWCNRCKQDRDVNDDISPGRLKTSTSDENIEAVTKMISHYRLIREVADDVQQFLRMF